MQAHVCTYTYAHTDSSPDCAPGPGGEDTTLKGRESKGEGEQVVMGLGGDGGLVQGGWGHLWDPDPIPHLELSLPTSGKSPSKSPWKEGR